MLGIFPGQNTTYIYRIRLMKSVDALRLMVIKKIKKKNMYFKLVKKNRFRAWVRVQKSIMDPALACH